LRATTKKRSSTFLRKKVHPGDLAGGFSDLEMTWLLSFAGPATGCENVVLSDRMSAASQGGKREARGCSFS